MLRALVKHATLHKYDDSKPKAEIQKIVYAAICESLVEFEEFVGKLRKTNTNDSPSSLFLSRHIVTLMGRLQELGLSMINILNERETSDRKKQQTEKEL